VDVERVNHGDADRTVVDRTLALAARRKGRTEPLIGKRGIYEVDLSSPDGDPVSVRWDVSTGPLSLLVEEEGGL